MTLFFMFSHYTMSMVLLTYCAVRYGWVQPALCTQDLMLIRYGPLGTDHNMTVFQLLKDKDIRNYVGFQSCISKIFLVL